MRAMKLDTSERMAVAFIWNADQEFDGFPVSLPFRPVNDVPFIYTHKANEITGTSDAGMFELETTWNTTGAPTAFWSNITDTASAPLSYIFEYLVNGLTMASLLKTGELFAPTVRTDMLLAKNAIFAVDGTVVFNGAVEFNGTVAGGITTDNMHLTGNLTVMGYVDFAHGLVCGPTNVQIIGDDGRIPAISDVYFADLSGVHLTGVGLLGASNDWTARQNFTGYSEEHTLTTIDSGLLTIDMALGSVFEFTMNANITGTTLANVPPDGKYASFVALVNANGTAFTWPWFASTVHWPAGSVPTRTITAGRFDKFFFWTKTGGSVWYGSVVAQNYTP
jgi:hypothetical protein